MIWPLRLFKQRKEPDANARNPDARKANSRAERERKRLLRFFKRHPDLDRNSLDPNTMKAGHLAERLSIEQVMSEKVRLFNEAKAAAERDRKPRK